MNAHPRSTTERIANDVLNGHIGTELRTVVDVRGLAERRVGTADVVVVAAQHNGCFELAAADSVVEGQGNLRATFSIGIEDAGLRAHHQVVRSSFANPMQVVFELSTNVVGHMTAHLVEHFGSKAVGGGKVVGIARGANPAERTETIVEEQRTHDVLHIRRIAIALASLLEHIGSGTTRFQQEGITIVEEVHVTGGQLVDGSHLSAQRCLHGLLEAFRLLGHHAFALFEAVAHRIVAASPRIVQRCLVATQINMDVFLGQSLPEVYDVSYVGHRHHSLLGNSLANGGNQLVEVGMQLVHPALLIALACRLRIDFGRHAHHAGYVASFRLSS